MINPPTEEYERKLLETTEQLSCAQDLLLFTTEKLAETTDQLSRVQSELLTANSQLAETKKLLVEAKLELSSMQKKCATLHSKNVKLSSKIVSEKLLVDNDKMVKYYTGLP